MSIVAKRSPISATAERLSDTSSAFNLPNLHLAPPFGLSPFKFCQDLRNQSLGYGETFVCVTLRLAVSVEHRLVTEGQTDERTDRETGRHATTGIIRHVRRRRYRHFCHAAAADVFTARALLALQALY